MDNLEDMIKEIELISKQECDSTFNHQENTKSKRDAHFRGIVRGKASMARACMIVINQLQNRIKENDKFKS